VATLKGITEPPASPFPVGPVDLPLAETKGHKIIYTAIPATTTDAFKIHFFAPEAQLERTVLIPGQALSSAVDPQGVICAEALKTLAGLVEECDQKIGKKTTPADVSQFTSLLSKLPQAPSSSHEVVWQDESFAPLTSILAAPLPVDGKMIKVADAGVFQLGDVCVIKSTGEKVMVIAVEGATLTVQRAMGAVPPTFAETGSKIVVIAPATSSYGAPSPSHEDMADVLSGGQSPNKTIFMTTGGQKPFGVVPKFSAGSNKGKPEPKTLWTKPAEWLPPLYQARVETVEYAGPSKRWIAVTGADYIKLKCWDKLLILDTHEFVMIEALDDARRRLKLMRGLEGGLRPRVLIPGMTLQLVAHSG